MTQEKCQIFLRGIHPFTKIRVNSSSTKVKKVPITILHDQHSELLGFLQHCLNVRSIYS